MTLKKVYRSFVDIITPQEAEKLESYVIDFIDGNVEIKREIYKHQKLDRTIYFIRDYCDIDKILSKDPNCIINISYTNNNLNFEEHREYSAGTLIRKHMVLYDPISDNFLCTQDVDPISGEPIKGSTEKFSYKANGEQEYIFLYLENGKCYDIIDEDGIVNVNNKNWKNYEYYKFATPFIPCN